ncbi:nuclear transport factor 2 family protein [Tardiphaga alba]|uniref:Nuclear transport factor 2 family protein n=1 Tax=Tardiphaga alba TaxID=340268 RepID=A0ABX8AFZ6_9BRAD|nr:nuclear transport factor 2 family protein [Tardiphaga alba]QUS42217.1 nuclear transport factor 2 family protein [Tardiphaga alba]
MKAWNAHDVEAVLAHFHEDVRFASPIAAAMLPGSSGVISGKAALREYWTVALNRVPDLRFTIENVFQGVGIVVIEYRNQKDVLVSEVLIFDGEKVTAGYGTYPPSVENPAGAQVDSRPDRPIAQDN